MQSRGRHSREIGLRMYHPGTMERCKQPPTKGDGPTRGALARRRNQTNKDSELEGTRKMAALGKDTQQEAHVERNAKNRDT